MTARDNWGWQARIGIFIVGNEADAVLDDGLFDVMVVKPLSRFNFIRIFPRVFEGTHVSDPRVSIDRAAHVTIGSETAVAYADGERIARAPVTVSIDAKSMRVLAP